MPSLEEALARARAGNRELDAARRTLEAARERAAAARWDAFPALDLTGSLGGNGLAGEPVPFVTVDESGAPDTLRVDVGTGLGDSFGDVLAGEFPAWSVGLHLTFPIGLREDRGERDRLRAEVRRAEVRVIEAERDLEERVRAVVRRLANASERLRLAREGVDASLEQARIGQIEYRNGRTTAFEIVRLGADVAEAQGRYSDALVRAAKAAADLERLAPTRIPDIPGKETP